MLALTQTGAIEPPMHPVYRDLVRHKVLDHLWYLVSTDKSYETGHRAFIPVAIGTWDDTRDPKDTLGDVTIHHAVFAQLEFRQGFPELVSRTPPPAKTKEELRLEADAAAKAAHSPEKKTRKVREWDDPSGWDYYDPESNSPRKRD